MKKKYRIISLFAGCGGMDLGFLGGFNIYGQKYHRLPFEIVYANELNPKAALTYAENFSHSPVVGDISELNLNDLPEADVVLGGFPCQPFSLAGKRGGFDDDKGRGNLYLEMKKVINHVKPKMFIAENVDGLRTHTTGDVKTLELIVKDLSEEYDVEYRVLKAVDYGVPQTRVRIFIIGKRKDLKGEIIFPDQTHASVSTSRLKKHRSTEEGIGDLEALLGSPDAPSNHTLKDYSKARFQPGKSHQGNAKEPRDKPAHTVRAEAHGNQYAHYNSVGSDPESQDMSTWRRLSVRECARLQSFPDSFIFPVAQSSAHKQIGNAVPPVLAWHIAKSVNKTLKDIEFHLSL